MGNRKRLLVLAGFRDRLQEEIGGLALSPVRTHACKPYERSSALLTRLELRDDSPQLGLGAGRVARLEVPIRGVNRSPVDFFALLGRCQLSGAVEE
jgi:hypothetical protein